MLHVFRSVAFGVSQRSASGLPAALLLCLVVSAVTAGTATAAEPAESEQATEANAAGLAFFERKIRPVLIRHCYECHSAESKQLEGSLLVDTKAGLLAGGDSGPSLVPGKPEESLLISALHYAADSYQMPPRGKLPDAVIADFEKWVAMGAPDPRTDSAGSKKKATGIDFAAAREFWSFQPPQPHTPPAVRQTEWPRRPIDAFILAQLEAEGWAPSPEAARRTLLRRATFDLTGLPPTPAEIRLFLEDTAPGAYTRLIERLLESPHYGERWARHWLDVARYAEDNTNMGPFNGPYDHAWRYRDWVVQALNSDMPYDEFVRRQLATDLMDSTGNDDLPALGFVAVAPSYHKELNLAKVELDNRFADEWEDRVDGIGRGLLGLTLACARCHDHKYDPVSNRDYYSLAGVFASTRQTTRTILPDDIVQKSEPARQQAAALQAEIADLQKEIKAEQTRAAAHQKAVAAAEAAAQKAGRRAAVIAEKTVPFDIAAANSQIAAKKKEIASLKAATPNFDLPMANVLTEETVLVDGTNPNRSALVYKPNEPRDLPLFIRGDAGRLGDVVPRGFLTVLSPGDDRQKFQQGSGRLELAEAIVSRDNPLTARVIVNRVWAAHFGTGIVSTPSNFGETGARPTHPQLLDDLAVRFMNNGWSLKWLHREIMLSATYRQTSAVVEDNVSRDPSNRLLGRFNRRRLDVEAFRDAILAATGTLDRSPGGPSADATDLQNLRRTLYSTVSRHRLNDFLQAFDFPDPAIHAAKRSETTTPLQQLFVLNSPWMRTQAAALARSLNNMPDASLTEKIHEAYARLYGREPGEQELAIAREFLENRSGQAATPADAGHTEAKHEPPTFDGSRVRGNVPGLGDTYSVELWFRNTLPNNKRPITGYFFSRGRVNAAGSPGDHLGISGTARKPGVLLFYNGDTLKQSHMGSTIIEPGSWHHVVLIRENGAIRVHLDGKTEPELSGPARPGYTDGIADILIGGRNDGFASFVGQLSHVAVYSRVLSTKEIAQHAAAPGSPRQADSDRGYPQVILGAQPLVYWPLAGDAPGSRRAADLTATASHAEYEDRQGAATDSETPDLWERYAHALLSGNELLFVD